MNRTQTGEWSFSLRVIVQTKKQTHTLTHTLTVFWCTWLRKWSEKLRWTEKNKWLIANVHNE